MKYLLPLILFLPLGLFAQNDSLNIQHIDICPNLFKDSMIDSSYINFYIENNIDTIYFNNVHCVQLHQITDPFGTTLWKTNNGVANGQLEYHYEIEDEWIIKKGQFSNGYFVNGFEEVYYSNGKLKTHGAYENGRTSGVWKWYTEDGKLDYKSKIIDGIGIIE